MAVSSTSPRRPQMTRLARWAVPVVVAGGVALGFTLSAPSSDAVPTLPARTPAQLIAAVEGAGDAAYSGTVTQSAALGLPSLPGGTSDASLSWQNLLLGSHTARVWVDGPTKQRAAVLGDLSEADVIHNGSDVWTYTSRDNSVSHTVLPDAPPHHGTTHQGTTHQGTAHQGTPDLTPQAAAQQLLAQVTPTTAVTVDTAQRVAGRPAYTLVVQPKQSGSTIRSIRLAIDSATSVPLRLQVFGQGSAPAFELGFSDVSFATPPADTFDFHPPAGATTGKDPFGVGSDPTHGQSGPTHGRSGPKTTTIGSGWTTVAELTGVDLGSSSSGHAGRGTSSMLSQIATPVDSSGAKLLHTALVNALLLPDGRAFVGAVTPDVLEHVAATH